MILFELTETENNPLYQQLEIANGDRQYDFLRSIVGACIQADRRFLSQHIIKALNFHAITCLHIAAGEYRPCEVHVGTHEPPAFYRVQALMDDFVNQVNRRWDTTDPVVLATWVLWRLNYIHPFINGNGRTARAASYFVLCVALGGLLPGEVILPQLLKRNRPRYVAALKAADDAAVKGVQDMSELHALMMELLAEQLRQGAETQPPNTSTPSAAS